MVVSLFVDCHSLKETIAVFRHMTILHSLRVHHGRSIEHVPLIVGMGDSHDSYGKEEEFEIFCNLLGQKDSLYQLCLCPFYFGDSLRDMRLLCRAIGFHSNLEEIFIQETDLEDDQIEILCQSLGSPRCRWMNLSLHMNNISDRGAEHIAAALSSNLSLLVLNLGQNGIGDAGIMAIGHALRQNCSLLELWLTDNPGITQSGLIGVKALLLQNTVLSALHLDSSLCLGEQVEQHFKANKGRRDALFRWGAERDSMCETTEVPSSILHHGVSFFRDVRTFHSILHVLVEFNTPERLLSFLDYLWGDPKSSSMLPVLLSAKDSQHHTPYQLAVRLEKIESANLLQSFLEQRAKQYTLLSQFFLLLRHRGHHRLS